MKRVLLMVFSFLCIISCNTPIQEKAEKQLRQTINSQQTNGEVIISDVDTIYTEDSLCVLQFSVKGKDWYGEEIKGRGEYIFKIYEDGSKKEVIYDFSELQPIMVEIEETAKKEYYVGMNESLKRQLLSAETRLRLITRGHIIEDISD